jgi:hypothetical protein
VGLRETLNENPAITTRVTLVVLLFAIGIIVWQLLPPPKQIPKDFYTIDDGKTTFVDNAAKYPPFLHDGKPAVRARVFTCDGKVNFVAWLERFSPQARNKLEQAAKAPHDSNSEINTADIESAGLQVKLPGVPDNEWTTQSNLEKYTTITNPKCPDGKDQSPSPVMPQ